MAESQAPRPPRPNRRSAPSQVPRLNSKLTRAKLAKRPSSERFAVPLTSLLRRDENGELVQAFPPDDFERFLLERRESNGRPDGFYSTADYREPENLRALIRVSDGGLTLERAYFGEPDGPPLERAVWVFDPSLLRHWVNPDSATDLVRIDRDKAAEIADRLWGGIDLDGPTELTYVYEHGHRPLDA